MNTPISRYKWLKLPFGIKSAPERAYQRAMDEMLENIDNAYAIMDDLLILERDVGHHNSVLKTVLYHAQSYDLSVNFEKVRVQKQLTSSICGSHYLSRGAQTGPRKSES